MVKLVDLVHLDFLRQVRLASQNQPKPAPDNASWQEFPLFTTQALYTIGQVAQQIGVSRSRLAYLIETGQAPQPTASVPGRRLFSTSDALKVREVLESMGEITLKPSVYDPALYENNSNNAA